MDHRSVYLPRDQVPLHGDQRSLLWTSERERDCIFFLYLVILVIFGTDFWLEVEGGGPI